ncbi:carboxypeptidase-like regulatory domain-containing protein [Edaphobacter albus]|uniref:carboxypeptidase-like regulatory domain-containing protein n=1 Tax=Edaphobacter sp. 4G125 TaxID=2763071 RepID=UPI0016470A7F|nr:carboxypeptidase-like regulatory domain-containing protein [Edaphobacter sp. 4G125]QNI37056.1 carboxypeptidase regulatory-like domain-containing protein [Edaphobacter sp. 4G125]
MGRLKNIIALVIFICLSSALHAQATATVTGVVTDPSGSVIPDATAVLSNPSMGTDYTTTTNTAGSYRFTSIPPGPGYTLVISRSGFNSFKVENIYVNVANVVSRNATLTPGTQVEVSVSAAGQGVTLNTEDATLGNNLQVQKLDELPIQNRTSPAILFRLQPGTTLTGEVTGARYDQNYVSVDTLDVNDLATGQFGAITANAPVDSVQEFRGTVAGSTANTGLGGGGQFVLVTRSGTNNWHGQANLYHRDNSTTANDWFNNLAGIRAPKLVRNQFGGSVGGPILHDKAFFFFDYTASRIAAGAATVRKVPLPSYRSGLVSYINDNPNCDKSSRQNTTPGCISQLTAAQVRNVDPAGIGESPALFNLYNSRYPAVNDVTYGDGVNTGGFRFNAPNSDNLNIFVGRVDYNLTDKIRLWGRGTVSRENAVNAVQQFPGDPDATDFIDRSYAYVGGIDWQVSSNKFNQFTYGSTVQDYNFTQPTNKLGIDQLNFSTGSITFLDRPYSSPINAQGRHVPIPQIYDNFTWSVGRHSITFGGMFKWIKNSSYSILDYNDLGIGIGGNLGGLTASFRPTNVQSSVTARSTYDNALVAALGRISNAALTFNYGIDGSALPQPSGSQREYQSYQTQVFASDSWKATPHLTLTYGLGYQYYSVPYEIHGFETAQNTLFFNDYIAQRVQQSQAGNTAADGLPFLTYQLGGAHNNGPALYHRDPLNFSPKVAFAWNPKFDEKTVFNGGAGVVYDRTVINAVQYQQDQYSYLFQQSLQDNFGTRDPLVSLTSDPRLDSLPTFTAPPTPRPPFTPFVDGGIPNGLIDGQFNQMIDPNLKTPYSIMANLGFQHEFPGSTILKVSWVGRFGRRLLAQADANQVIEFPDKASGQLLGDAMGNVTKQLRANADPRNLPAQGWFENQIPPGYGATQTYEDDNGVTHNYPNNTSWIADNLQTYIARGDFADTVQQLSPFLGNNVGMASQFAGNNVFTSKGFSTYNGLLVTVQKNLTQGLQFDANYTWSHSIDNTSLAGNQQAIGGYGFICDVLRPRLCRANSDFDTTHYINADATYSLPFGRGRTYGANMPWLLDEMVGGWDLSNIVSWHTGVAFSTVSSAFVAGYANNAPAIFTGDSSDIQRKVHKTQGGTLTLFADPQRAVGAFEGPIGFQIGPRNSLRGPQYFNLDTGLAKTFTLMPERGLKLKFRGDAFNILNHPNFAAPGNNSSYDDITLPSNFGQLTSMANSTGGRGSSARVVQISARFEF